MRSHVEGKSNVGNNIFGLNVWIFAALLVLMMLYSFNASRILGLVALGSTLAIPLIYFMVYIRKIKVTNLLVTWIFYSIYGVINLINNYSILGISTFIKHSLLLFCVVILSQSCYSKGTLMKLSSFFTNLYKVVLVSVLLSELFLSSDIINQFLYKMTIMCTFFAILKTDKVYKYSFVTIAVLSITSTRSAILSIILFMMIFKTIGNVKKSKLAYQLTFFLIVTLIIGIPILYSQLQYSPLGLLLNEYSRDIFSKNFFSGRQYIWEYSLIFIKNNMFYGHGFSNTLLVNMGIDASTHNLYLNLLMQGGLILLALFLLFMYQIWMKYYHHLDDRTVRLSASFLLPTMLRADFDLLLLENDLVISIYLWIPIIIGLAYINNIKKTKNIIN